MVLDEERLAKIALVHFPGFGSQRLRLLKHVFHSYATAWRAKRGELVQTRLPESVVDTFLAWRLKADPMKFVHALEDARIRCLFPEDDDFPTLLRRSSDPPELLFVRGSISPAPAVAVVGTRKATSYGAHTTRELVTPLARAGLCIVSGLALGIDGIAHRAALEAQGPTVAFLATGIDDLSIYPKEHARLAERILDAGGALVSESPPGTPGLKHLFPLRNRLIASFSLATLVVEAALESGSLITAKLALEENREVLAVPGPIWSEQSHGTNHLLKLGARPCTSPQDVLDALSLDRPDLVAKARSELPRSPEDDQFLAHLGQPIHIDTLATLAKAPVAHVSSQLSILELKGLVQHLGGQVWVASK